MTVQTDYEDRAVWLPKLIAWAEQGRDHYEAAASVQRQHGHLRNADGYQALADGWQLIADRARVLLVPGTQPVGLADACAAEAEPPRELVPFVDWLRLKWGALLPGLSVETWQAIGCLILLARGLRP